MAQPAPKQPESPQPWYAGLIGFIVAALVLSAAAAATAVSYDSDGGHDDVHADTDEGDHAEDDTDEGDHAEDDTDDDHADE